MLFNSSIISCCRNFLSLCAIFEVDPKLLVLLGGFIIYLLLDGLSNNRNVLQVLLNFEDSISLVVFSLDHLSKVVNIQDN
jgi:hypothetical protein